jgi:hypothetical protein
MMIKESIRQQKIAKHLHVHKKMGHISTLTNYAWPPNKCRMQEIFIESSMQPSFAALI